MTSNNQHHNLIRSNLIDEITGLYATSSDVMVDRTSRTAAIIHIPVAAGCTQIDEVTKAALDPMIELVGKYVLAADGTGRRDPKIGIVTDICADCGAGTVSIDIQT